MLAALVQLSIIGIWGAVFTVHTRRLLRLAQVETIDTLRNHALRHRIDRVWWWLGREEFWLKVQHDCLQSIQLTIMLLIIGWNFMI